MTEDKRKAFDFMVRLSKSKHPLRELDKTYWVVEWSWQSICDGIFPYEETLRFVQPFVIEFEYDSCNGKWVYCCPVYQTRKNNRYYFPWEICDSMEDAANISNIVNQFGYGYDSARNDVLRWLVETSGQSFIDKSINGIRL